MGHDLLLYVVEEAFGELWDKFFLDQASVSVIDESISKNSATFVTPQTN